MAASEETASTISSAGCRLASIALRISSTHVRAPVEVSLWTTHTALMSWPLSFLRRASTALASAPECQSVGSTSGFSPSFAAMLRHSTANCPVSTTRMRSPGDSVLTRLASQAPVPEEGKMTTGLVVLNSVLTLASRRVPNSWNSGPRWSSICRDMALRMRSGIGVGPGICRKWRPAGRLSIGIGCPLGNPLCFSQLCPWASLPAETEQRRPPWAFFCRRSLSYR